MFYKKLSLSLILSAAIGFLIIGSATVSAQESFESKFSQKSQIAAGKQERDDRDLGASKSVDPKGIVVDDDRRCPGTRFTSIQAAVDASSAGSVIQVCPGIYNEQVRINKRLTIVGVEYQNENQAVVKPNPATANTTSLLPSHTAIAAIILVENGARVNLENLVVDGATNRLSSCTPNLVGIFYRNSSGTVDSVAVRNIKSTTNSCENSTGIFAQSGNGGHSEVSVVNSSVHDYEKTGIMGNEPGTVMTIAGNAVTGLGSTASIVQNGIQIGYGARGQVFENSVINHIYSPCTTRENCIAATNILVVDANHAQILRNNTGKGNVNIYVQGDGADVALNTVFDADIGDGIALVGDNNDARFNRIFNSDSAGIFIQGSQNQVQNNFINEAQFGLLRSGTGTGNDLRNNRFFNTVFNVASEDSPDSSERAQAISVSPTVRITGVRF